MRTSSSHEASRARLALCGAFAAACLLLIAAGPARAALNPTGVGIVCDHQTIKLEETASCTVSVDDLRPEEDKLPTTPTGTVSISTSDYGQFTLNPCNLVGVNAESAHCSFTYRPFLVGSGSHVLTAHYGGDGKHPATDGSRTLVVVRPTRTTVSCAPSTVAINELTTCIATAADPSASPTAPTGAIAFGASGAGTLSVGSCDLAPASAGTSSCAVTYRPLAIGPQTINGRYGGDATHEPSRGEANVSVVQPPHPTATAIACEATTLSGAVNACVVTVTDSSSTPAVPSGTIALSSDNGGGSFQGPCVLQATGTGSSSCDVGYLPKLLGSGTHRLSASFSGDASEAASEGSTTVGVTNPVTVEVECSPAEVSAGEAVECSALVSDEGDERATPTGTVEFTAEGATAGFESPSCDLGEGEDVAACAVVFTPTAALVGAVHITASYGGDPLHAGGSGEYVLTVVPAEEPPREEPRRDPPPPPPPGAPEAAPNTSFAKRPTRPRRVTHSRVVRAAFASDLSRVSFQCRLDRGAFRACSSPFRAKVKLGTHKLQVRAVNAEGVPDATPAVYRWRVVPPSVALPGKRAARRSPAGKP
jgi:hypothetical protein